MCYKLVHRRANNTHWHGAHDFPGASVLFVAQRVLQVVYRRFVTSWALPPGKYNKGNTYSEDAK